MHKIKFFLIAFALVNIIGCSSGKKIANSPEPGIYIVSIMYPAGKDKTFNMDYYEKNHMPMMAGFIGKNLKYYQIDKGISGRAATDEAPYVAMCHFYVYDIAEYNKSVGQNIEAVRADIKNYTNIQPVVQVSKVQGFSSHGVRE